MSMLSDAELDAILQRVAAAAEIRVPYCRIGDYTWPKAEWEQALAANKFLAECRADTLHLLATVRLLRAEVGRYWSPKWD